MQIIIPQTVGSAKASKVHFVLPLSFFILISVVLHGKCKSVNIITLIPVSNVHPFCFKTSPIAKVLSISTKLPVAR